jgi:hypothetical protein
MSWRTLYPASTHEAIEVLTGPFSVPLVTGGLYIVAPGYYVRLEDRSIWRVNDDDAWKIQNWLPDDALQISENRSWFSSVFKYTLYNLHTQVKIQITPEVGPQHSSPFRRYIYDCNLITGEVILNDGSLWQISTLDSDKFRSWLQDDSITVGVNEDWLSFKRPNLLINFSTNDCVRVRWLN